VTRTIYFNGKLNPKATDPLQNERNKPQIETQKNTTKNKIRRYIFSTIIRTKKDKTIFFQTYLPIYQPKLQFQSQPNKIKFRLKFHLTN